MKAGGVQEPAAVAAGAARPAKSSRHTSQMPTQEREGAVAMKLESWWGTTSPPQKGCAQRREVGSGGEQA